ncbi:MAG TPA: right-handed parallel beta-helix repeat-containing protein, partial [Acidimicrobiia bacterium]
AGIRSGRDAGDWHMTDVWSINNDGVGFYIQTNLFAKGLRARSNGSFGMLTSHAAWVVITTSFFRDNGNHGISGGGLDGGLSSLRITNSVIRGNSGAGIKGDHDAGNTAVVVGNEVIGNSGISIDVLTGSVVHSNLIHSNGTDTPQPDQGNMVDGVWTGGSDDFATEAPQAVTFASQPSTELTVGSGSFRFVAPRAGTIVAVRASCGDAPTGADVIVDVNLNGSTIFSTQSNRPTVADGTNNGAETTPNTTAVVGGDWLTVDVDQIGSTYGGADLTVTLEIVWETT